MYKFKTSSGGARLKEGEGGRERERERERENNVKTLNSRKCSQSIKEFSSVIFLQFNDRAIKVVKGSSGLNSVGCMLECLCEFTVREVVPEHHSLLLPVTTQTQQNLLILPPPSPQKTII